MHTVHFPSHFKQWRTIARSLLSQGLPPDEVLWQDPQQTSLFAQQTDEAPRDRKAKAVPKAFLKLAQTISCHRSNEQWSLLYSLLWRLSHGDKQLLSKPHDPQVRRAQQMAKQIGRDLHKMHAFVRFKKVGEAEQREQFVAWFEPEHLIVRLSAPFFKNRFASMDWSILTPDECVHWSGSELHYSEGVDQSLAEKHDHLDELWRTYYRSIFNPARLKVRAMQSEMPQKYWKNLPEADLIEELITKSKERTQEMLNNPLSPVKPAPKNTYLERLKELEK